uniref:Putative sgs n=1 Tax=Aedes aegypti TaxID=7159 RepID=A0A0P6IV74_AEDAE
MQDENFIRIKEVLYDEIDRSIVNTKWTTVEKNGSLFFDFHEKFIESVESNQLTGLVHDLNPDCEGYPYFRKDYADSPITEEVTISMPGKIFSEDTKYSRQLARQSKYVVLDRLFPSTSGFTQQVEIRQNKTFHVVVNDANNQKVAYFVAGDSSDARITTYEYDSEGNLILELPPMYHNATATLNLTIPFWDRNLTQTELKLQDQWGVRYTYNDKDQLSSKRMPDSGIQQYIYDGDVVRFLVHMDNHNKTDKTVFFSYGSAGQIIKEAVVDVALTDFNQYLNGSALVPDSKNYIEYYHGEYDESPNMRHRSQQSIRRIGDKHMIESLINDDANRIVKKIYIVPTLNTSYAIDYEYLNDKLSMIQFPIGVNGTGFKVRYAYNNAGDMIAIGTTADPEKFVKLQYNADGLVREMQFEPGSSYSYRREYSYNEPGYLKRISDMFLEETVSYLEGDGYGNAFSMIFEGLISRTTFNATWFERSNPALSKLRLDGIDSYDRTLTEFCIKQLQLRRYYDNHFHPIKSFYPKLDSSISEACRSKQFYKAFHVNQFPRYYGHSYDYDNHEQLIRAKYFQSQTETSLKPLVETSFSSIKGINETVSNEIWNILMENDFVSNNCYHGGICEGLPGNRSLLNTLIPNKSYVQAFMLKAVSKMKTLTDADFMTKCLKWFEHSENGEQFDCTELKKQLQIHNMIGLNSNQTLNALNSDLQAILSSYSQYIPQIVQKLHKHFATRLGESPADVLSCRFDANGNHRLFRKGSIRYSFEYTNGTNQINTVTKTDTYDSENSIIAYAIVHNSEGSVTVAQHKNIEKIEYDPLLNRPSSIHISNGRKLKFEYDVRGERTSNKLSRKMAEFEYDVRGERTFKQVIEKDGYVSKEKYYIRDLNRNVLVDLQLTYVAQNKTPDIQVTSYIYSDQGLVGFVRNDEFYSVFTDHEGSTRLVIKDGEVKAAYDYLPFGIIFRKSERDLDGALSYLYTGQEWDEETGLYNYHTRLYDPEIGRFYQIDPKNQYASPYIYAGNSPIGLVDPDGQFFMTLIAIALAIVGAYLGAAAANGSWDPTEWNWKSGNTWLALITGALAGATLPSSAVATFAYFTTTLGLSVSTSLSIMVGSGIGFSYFSMAAANNDWNPDHWDMKSPATWNAFFAGISTSVNVMTNPHNLASSYSAITSTVGKGLFIGGKLILTTGFAYILGVIQQNGEFDPSKWDFSKPGLYMSLFNGAVRATSTVRFLSNLPENFKLISQRVGELISSKQLSIAFLNFKQHLGSDWSKQISNTRHILHAYSGNLKVIGKGSYNVLLYTTVSSLRISKIVDNDKVPELGIALEIINQIEKATSISDYLANNLDLTEYPKVKDGSYRLKRSIMEDSQYNSTSSGASSFSRLFLNFISFRFGNHNPPVIPKSKEMNTYSSQVKSSVGKTFTIPNCFKLHPNKNENPSIKCYGHHSQTSIHYKTYHAEITQDRFQSCYPIYYNGIPSVSCEGQESSLLFTSYETPRLFDHVDGWILLARVIPTAIKNIVSGVRRVCGCDGSIPSEPVSETELISMMNDHAGLGDLTAICENSEWARKAIDELNEDLSEFMNEPTRNRQMYGVLKERIAALRDDVLEEMELFKNEDQIISYLGEQKLRMLEVAQTVEVKNMMPGKLQYPEIGLLN